VPAMEVAVLLPESEYEHLRGCAHELLNDQIEA
jgi:hypothetical protein